MKLFVTFLLFFFTILCNYGQISNVQEEFALPSSLSESSGAIVFNGVLITHNDSGGQNTLYELDLNTEAVVSTITITNATNVDWEDIAQDDTHIYIGDFGNNDGSRTDLKIYKILKSDFISSTSVNAEIINFSYADQTDFTSSPQNTEWDAEALISLNSNELMIISKNWVNNVSSSYTISKTPGTYNLLPQTTTLSSGGLVTGATFNELSGKVYLSGYTEILQPFIWVCESFLGNDIFSGTNTQTMLSTLAFEQIEGITHTSENEYLATSESFAVSIISDFAKLISFSTSDVTLSLGYQKDKKLLALYPNPVADLLNIETNNLSSVEIFNMQSAKLYQGVSKQVDMSLFSSGVYLVKINFKDHSSIVKRIVKQ